MSKNKLLDYQKQNPLFSPGFRFEYPFFAADDIRTFIYVNYAKYKGNRLGIEAWISLTNEDMSMVHQCSPLLVRDTLTLPKRNMSHDDIQNFLFSNLIDTFEFRCDVWFALTNLFGIDVYDNNEAKDGSIASDDVHIINFRFSPVPECCNSGDLMVTISYEICPNCGGLIYNVYVIHAANPARLHVLRGEETVAHDATDPENIRLNAETILFQTYNRRKQEIDSIVNEMMPDYIAQMEQANAAMSEDLDEMDLPPADITVIRGDDGSNTIIAPKGMDDDTEWATNAFLSFVDSMLKDSLEDEN